MSARGRSGVPVLAVSKLAGLCLASSIMSAKTPEKPRHIGAFWCLLRSLRKCSGSAFVSLSPFYHLQPGQPVAYPTAGLHNDLE